MLISSHSNPKIKAIRALRHRKERSQTGQAFIEGIRIVADAAQVPGTIQTLIIAPELLTSTFAQKLVQTQREKNVPCLEVSAEVFKSLSLKEGPQGIGAIIRQHWEALEQVELTNDFCWVALDAIQDPGNLGTILRTCDAVGCTGIILLDQSTDPYDPEALRASMGAVFYQRLVKTTFEAFVDWKQRHGIYVVGTSGASNEDYRSVSYHFPLVLLMGSERQGLSAQQQAACDLMVKIPMVGRSDSLNLAVATGIVLYELFYQRHSNKRSI
jgi:TrmH family RNA methyltransferase